MKKTRLNNKVQPCNFLFTRHAVSVVYNLLYGRMVIASQVHAPFVRKAGGLQSADKASLR